MGILKKNMVSYGKFCTEMEVLSFNYQKIEEVEKLEMYDVMLDAAESAENEAKEMFTKMGFSKDMIKSIISKSDNIFDYNSIMEGTHIFIKTALKDKSINIEGYCLKTNVLNHAVQMRNNKDTLGFITELVEGSTRFVMVDFGEPEGAVKIDIEELNIG